MNYKLPKPSHASIFTQHIYKHRSTRNIINHFYRYNSLTSYRLSYVLRTRWHLRHNVEININMRTKNIGIFELFM